ncbi:MAG TPA: hypothetical protein VMC09_09675 [Anaerolineales bacterium]|nr:hypothetical protein [Anaerolineales bacterium]
MNVAQFALGNFCVMLLFSACGGTGVQSRSTPTFPPSDTPASTPASRSTESPTPTGIPSNTQTPYPTQAYAATATRQEDMFQSLCPYGFQDLSPSGRWGFCETYIADSAGVIVASKAGQIWTFSYLDYFGTRFGGESRLIYWSQDDRFLYFAPRPIVDWVGINYSRALTLLRMDTTNGIVTTMLPEDMKRENIFVYYYALAISPTGRRLAYVNNASLPLKIHILDLKTGAESYLLMENCYWNAGEFTWTPDGQQLSFRLAGSGSCERDSYAIDISDLSSNPDQTPTPVR